MNDLSRALVQFKTAMVSRGLVAPMEIIADGRIHRCDAEGKHGRGDGAYLLHGDGIPAGGFENHRDGLGWQPWRADIGRKLMPAEEASHRAKVDSARRERDAEDARIKAEARERAARLWAESIPCSGHAYLDAKGLSSAHGARLHGDKLLIPLRDETGVLHSLQTIDVDGNKRFLPAGRIRGCFCPIGGMPDGALVVCEGFATACSIYEATGLAVAVALNAGNLLPVAQAMRARFPDLKIIIAADDDHQTPGNPGLTKATQAARTIRGYVATPDFGRATA